MKRIRTTNKRKRSKLFIRDLYAYDYYPITIITQETRPNAVYRLMQDWLSFLNTNGSAQEMIES
jgi:hypothetical protein